MVRRNAGGWPRVTVASAEAFRWSTTSGDRDAMQVVLATASPIVGGVRERR